MEEKERYIIEFAGRKGIEGFIDTKIDRTMSLNDVCNLLNQQDKENQQLKQQISDLEVKLAESERKNFELTTKLNLKEYAPAFCTLAGRDCKALGQIERLKQQLAEKDKEIENVTLKHLDMLRYFIRHNSKQGIIFSSDLEIEIEEIEQGEKIWQTKNFNQDKISFAVEQLEKVKEKINDCPITDYDTNKHFVKMYQSDAIRQLDNQIKQLKGKVKDE